jgi:hypothetical protein
VRIDRGHELRGALPNVPGLASSNRPLGSAPSGSGHSEPRLEHAAIDVVGPEDLGDIFGLVVGSGRDPVSYA